MYAFVHARVYVRVCACMNRSAVYDQYDLSHAGPGSTLASNLNHNIFISDNGLQIQISNISVSFMVPG